MGQSAWRQNVAQDGIRSGGRNPDGVFVHHQQVVCGGGRVDLRCHVVGRDRGGRGHGADQRALAAYSVQHHGWGLSGAGEWRGWLAHIRRHHVGNAGGHGGHRGELRGRGCVQEQAVVHL